MAFFGNRRIARSRSNFSSRSGLMSTHRPNQTTILRTFTNPDLKIISIYDQGISVNSVNKDLEKEFISDMFKLSASFNFSTFQCYLQLDLVNPLKPLKVISHEITCGKTIMPSSRIDHNIVMSLNSLKDRHVLHQNFYMKLQYELVDPRGVVKFETKYYFKVRLKLKLKCHAILNWYVLLTDNNNFCCFRCHTFKMRKRWTLNNWNNFIQARKSREFLTRNRLILRQHCKDIDEDL